MNNIKEDNHMSTEGKIRQYINLTNSCNADCEFCCMWSSSEKSRFMTFEEFKGIIDSKDNLFELQLEGGEPLLHKSMYQFMQYAISTGRCLKIIILTNGFLLYRHLKHLIEFGESNHIPITIKISVNYWLYNMNKNIVQKCREVYEETKENPNFNIILNVRLRHGDDWIVKLIEEAELKDISNIFYLQSYGRYENETEYAKPIIVSNIDDWFVYACDGKNFGKDLIARSNYERRL